MTSSKILVSKWKIEFTPPATKLFSKLDIDTQTRIARFLKKRVEPAEDPRALGKPLKGSDFLRYRVGDYRIICSIEDDKIKVLVLNIGHRRDVYR